ncbi:hypothetical protein AB0C42_24085 [Micromonospora taraxaci]|uniref:hypothetical protein n=1 Tax=Micromonospora taraxaci TaxID=1316803 RepID=UPI0033E3A53B
MATESGTAYVSLIPSAKGFARALKKDIAKEFAGSKLDTLIGDALAGTSVSVPVKPEFRPGDLPDELPVRRGREPSLPVRVDPLTKALQDDVRRELGVLTRDVSAQIEVGADTADLRTEIATAISQVEASLTADVPTEPAGRREYERQLRAQVAEVSRTVRARIEADVDVDLDKPLRSGKVDIAGEAVGKSLAGTIMGSLTSGLSSIAGPAVFIGLTAAALVAGPLIGATIAAGVLAGLGGGVIGLAFVSLAQDPLLRRAASGLAGTIQQTFAKAAGPLLGTEQKPGPLLLAMETLTDLVVELGPSLQQMFASIGPYIPTLAAGLAEFVRAVMPGLLDAVEASGPVIEALAFNLGPLGESLGRFFQVMAELSPAAIDALSVLMSLIINIIDTTSALIYILGAAFGGIYGWYEDFKAQTSGLWQRITSIFDGGGASVKQRIEALIGAAIRLFTGLWDRLTGGARGAVNSLASIVGGLRGRITSAVGNLGGLLHGAGRSLIQGLINGIRSMLGPLESMLNYVTSRIPAWKGPPDRDARLLEPAGSSIMGGLIRGIRREMPALRSELGAVTALVAGTPLATGPVGGYGLSTSAPAPAPLVAQWVGGDGDPIMRAIREHTRIYYGGDPTAAFASR